MTERSGDGTAHDQSARTAASRSGASRTGTAPSGGKAGGQSGGMTDRVNAAYSSGPVMPPPPDESTRKPTGQERFAAVLANSSTKGKRKPDGLPGTPGAKPKRVRKARLRLTHVDPWSVMKTSFLLAVALGIVTVVAVAVVWSVLDAAGVWTSIDQAVGDVVGDASSGFRIEDYLGLSRVMGFTMLVAVVDVILITVISTLGAFLYNLAAALLGGLEVVLAEEEE
jgi:hypothetical protein